MFFRILLSNRERNVYLLVESLYNNLYNDYLSCPPGLSSSQSNAIACTSSSTILCPPGSGKPSYVQGCYPCPAGTYQDGTMLTCQPCTSSSVSSTGATSCTSTCAFGSRDGAGGLGVCRYIVLYNYHIICLHM